MDDTDMRQFFDWRYASYRSNASSTCSTDTGVGGRGSSFSDVTETREEGLFAFTCASAFASAVFVLGVCGGVRLLRRVDRRRGGLGGAEDDDGASLLFDSKSCSSTLRSTLTSRPAASRTR